MFNRLSTLFSLLAVIVILAMINLTTPSDVGPLGVLVFFVMIYIVMYGVADLIVSLFFKAAEKRQGAQKRHYSAAIIAFGPVMLLLIQSFGSMSIATIAMVLVFIFLGCFVVKKRF